MRVLGIDIGLKRTGLAMSDERRLTVKILPNLIATNQAQALEKILSLIHEFAVTDVVIGRPEPRTTGSIAIASRADGFKKKLEDIIIAAKSDVKIYVWNEDMTSKRATEQLVLANVPQKKRRSLLDGASAAVLVEDFIAAMDRQ